jgi:hypothetical protein
MYTYLLPIPTLRNPHSHLQHSIGKAPNPDAPKKFLLCATPVDEQLGSSAFMLAVIHEKTAVIQAFVELGGVNCSETNHVRTHDVSMYCALCV